jgi:methionyl-tRNA synthetase
VKKPYYITTPIYYVTDAPHIGHLYTTTACDILARYEQMLGKDVWFLTGTDEHGQKIQKKAKENGLTPQALADKVVERYREAWKVYGIQYNDFIRTTEERHKKVVHDFVKRLMETGDIYLAEYEGWYCVPDESYWTETQVVDGKCPECGRPVEKLKEESYFFKMSAYQDKLLKHIEENPDFIFPQSRKNEVLGFIKQGLKDISVSRTTISWGIPMPTDAKGIKAATKEHKVYVWFDALTNYISALNPLEGDEKFKKYWPEAIHVVGKDILRFHAVYWPTFLLALGIRLPKQIIAHGWLTDSNRKISKSLGNAIDPIALATEVGVDGMRYFLFREFVFGYDGEYTKEIMYQRINSDLANDYGNCINRLSNMIPKYLGNDPIAPAVELAKDSELKAIAKNAVPEFHKELAGFGFQRAIEAAWRLVSGTNKFIENNAPWTLAKSSQKEDVEKLRLVLLHCHEALRIASLLMLPIIPTSAEKALGYLGDLETHRKEGFMAEQNPWGKGPKTIQVTKSSPLFPRLELKKEE